MIAPDVDPEDSGVVVAIPVVVGACMYGELLAFHRVQERSGFEAYRKALTLKLPSLTAEQLERFRHQLQTLGPKRFAAAWHVLVAFVDQVGVERAIAELNSGALYRSPGAN